MQHGDLIWGTSQFQTASVANMPDALDLLKTRRSIPAACLQAPGPDDDQLRDILTVAARVPDHGKLAPWRFVVVRGEDSVRAGEKLSELLTTSSPDEKGTRKAEEIRARYATVPLTVLIVSRTMEHPKIPEWEQYISAGSVAMNLIHAAVALGYGAQWLTGFVSDNAEASELFGVRAPEQIVAAIHIGTPSAPPTERDRPDIDALTTMFSAP